jgi:hypothetical protein
LLVASSRVEADSWWDPVDGNLDLRGLLHCPKNKLFQESLETSLFEVAVGRERFRYSFAIHYHKGNTIRERPIFVRTIPEEFNSLSEGLGLWPNNDYLVIGLKIIE